MRAVNLIPVERRGGTSVGVGRSQGGAYAVLVLAVGLAALTVLYGLARHEVASNRSQAASATTRAARETAAAEQLAPYTSFVAEREQRTQSVETLVDSRFDWAHVLHEIGRVLPLQASIGSLSGTIGTPGAAGSSSAASSSSTSSAAAGSTSRAAAGSTSRAAASSSSSASGGGATSTTPPGSVPTFTLSGCAISQPAVALTLERLRLIDGVDEVTLQSSSAGSSGSGAGGGAGGGCHGHDPSFAVTITFDPLPSGAAVAAATKTVSDSAGTSSAATPATKSGAGTK
ncbi:MAG TPA: hypothetical protein VK272_13895 [Solirubrobacteraceae bacterium]|nr:hypothetical protein [Solirubrobacteraceae bacterium]